MTARTDVAVFDALDTPGTILELSRRTRLRPLAVAEVLRIFRVLGVVEAVTLDRCGISALWYRRDPPGRDREPASRRRNP